MNEADMRILRLAALAADIHIVHCTCSNPDWPFKYDITKSDRRGHWNPLLSNGDAFELAIKLNIPFQLSKINKRDFCTVEPNSETQADFSKKLAIARREIVYAAAAIQFQRDCKQE